MAIIAEAIIETNYEISPIACNFLASFDPFMTLASPDFSEVTAISCISFYVKEW